MTLTVIIVHFVFVQSRQNKDALDEAVSSSYSISLH